MKDTSGQMTVEFMISLPVMLAVAVIAVNVFLFFSECAAFDRITRDAVRIHACSPAYGQSPEQSSAQVKQTLQTCFEKDYLECEVVVSNDLSGHATYTSTLIFYPTLFGMGLRSEILGIGLPSLKHSVEFTVDLYKPGVFV